MTKNSEGPRRKLSFWRVAFAILILLAIGYGAVMSLMDWRETKSSGSHKPWFAAYVDVTATPTYAFEQLGATSTHNVVLSFIVSSQSDPCTPSWGGAYNPNQASAILDLDRRIARLRQQGGNVIVSFGGLLNDELAINCTDIDKLLAAYQSIVTRYSIETIDLDAPKAGEMRLLQDFARWRTGLRPTIVQSRLGYIRPYPAKIGRGEPGC